MAEIGELRNHVDAALASLPVEAIQAADEVAVSWPIATYTASDGYVTIHHGLFGTRCVSGRILDAAGSGITGGDGAAQLSLNAFHCLDVAVVGGGDNALGYDNPVNIVATSRGAAPIHLTIDAKIGPGGDRRPEDVAFTVFAWDQDGNPVSGARFNWRCTVPISTIIG